MARRTGRVWFVSVQVLYACFAALEDPRARRGTDAAAGRRRMSGWIIRFQFWKQDRATQSILRTMFWAANPVILELGQSLKLCRAEFV